MIQLPQDKLGNRVMLTVGIVLLVIAALALYGYLTGAWEPLPD